MKKAIPVKQKKRGPGRPETGHEFLGVRLPKGTTATIDKWAADNDLSRSEAVRTLIEHGLKAKR
jgi:metal-responsive CopG/Arc/MetJ family transcriptional regulator